MATWREIEEDAPDFAARVRRRFGMGTNNTIATLRRNGGPRISASELEFADGEVTLGMMGGSVKLFDVLADPRIAVHSPTIEAPEGDRSWPGDAKLAGFVVETGHADDGPHEGARAFRIEVTEVVLTSIGVPPDHLVIESWHPGRGWQSRVRR